MELPKYSEGILKAVIGTLGLLEIAGGVVVTVYLFSHGYHFNAAHFKRQILSAYYSGDFLVRITILIIPVLILHFAPFLILVGIGLWRSLEWARLVSRGVLLLVMGGGAIVTFYFIIIGGFGVAACQISSRCGGWGWYLLMMLVLLGMNLLALKAFVVLAEYKSEFAKKVW